MATKASDDELQGNTLESPQKIMIFTWQGVEKEISSYVLTIDLPYEDGKGNYLELEFNFSLQWV